MMKVSILVLNFHCSLIKLNRLRRLTSAKLETALAEKEENTCVLSFRLTMHAAKG